LKIGAAPPHGLTLILTLSKTYTLFPKAKSPGRLVDLRALHARFTARNVFFLPTNVARSGPFRSHVSATSPFPRFAAPHCGLTFAVVGRAVTPLRDTALPRRKTCGAPLRRAPRGTAAALALPRSGAGRWGCRLGGWRVHFTFVFVGAAPRIRVNPNNFEKHTLRVHQVSPGVTAYFGPMLGFATVLTRFTDRVGALGQPSWRTGVSLRSTVTARVCHFGRRTWGLEVPLLPVVRRNR